MYACPHCREHTISLWRKVHASSIRPARCPKCKGLSYLSDSSALAATVLAEVLFWGGALAALVLWRWEPLVAVPLAVILLPVVVGLTFSLKPTDRDTAERLRRRVGIQVAVLVVVSVCAFWILGTSP